MVPVEVAQDGDAHMGAVSLNPSRGGGPKPEGTGSDRPGEVPSTGFLAVSIVVSNCSNENTNGVYVPAKPYAGKAVWHKAPSEASAETAEVSEESKEPKSKDLGERVIYYSPRPEKWFVGDALEEGGFTLVPSPGKAGMPPVSGWVGGVTIEYQADASGGLNVPAAMNEMVNLSKVEPWADQETCYVTMLKVLGNIVANPTEPKFFSIKIENAAIQNKILRHNGARGFLEAIGFRENAGALVLAVESSANAKSAHEVLQGFASDTQYANIRKERHAKAAEEMQKEAERKKYERPAQQRGGGYGDSGGGGGGKGGGGPMRG